METERRKIYKKKLSTLASEDSGISEKNKRRKNRSSNSIDTGVTVLGSPSYLDQNRTLSILMPQSSTNKTTKEDEDLKHCKDKPLDDNIQT